ncbi:hypothetical protein Pcinc_042466 [Petrolisthes cinctipes]|uniref:Uncharacterized protein n=1 Tax=Petrolisthes cinctipes TaxID=88211 RepID=A0AAE1BHG5_PETCI|nr:hypothetical protein Pcinc_042466 [Petrolisthes cinctipes]
MCVESVLAKWTYKLDLNETCGATPSSFHAVPGVACLQFQEYRECVLTWLAHRGHHIKVETGLYTVFIAHLIVGAVLAAWCYVKKQDSTAPYIARHHEDEISPSTSFSGYSPQLVIPSEIVEEEEEQQEEQEVETHSSPAHELQVHELTPNEEEVESPVPSSYVEEMSTAPFVSAHEEIDNNTSSLVSIDYEQISSQVVTKDVFSAEIITDGDTTTSFTTANTQEEEATTPTANTPQEEEETSAPVSLKSESTSPVSYQNETTQFTFPLEEDKPTAFTISFKFIDKVNLVIKRY